MLSRPRQPIRWMWKQITTASAPTCRRASSHFLAPHHHTARFISPHTSHYAAFSTGSVAGSSSATPLNPFAQPHGFDEGLSQSSTAQGVSNAPSKPAPPQTGAQYQANAASLTAQPDAAAASSAARSTNAASPHSTSSSTDATATPSSATTEPAATSATSTTTVTIPPPPTPATTTQQPAANNTTTPPAPTTPGATASAAPVSASSQSSRSPHPGYLYSDQTVFLSDGKQVTINELLRDRRVLLLGFVAAYTRLCQQSLSAYASRASELKKKYNVDAIVALSVNDHSVLSSFSSSLSIASSPSLALIADFDARVTRWLGMEVDLTAVGFGLRCKRFAMVVDRQQVRVVRVESNVGQLDVTSVDSMVAVLKEVRREDAEKTKEQQQQQQQGQAEQGRKGEAETAASAKSEVKGSGATVGATLSDLHMDEHRLPPLVQ